jgi:hypothetical protein
MMGAVMSGDVTVVKVVKACPPFPPEAKVTLLNAFCGSPSSFFQSPAAAAAASAPLLHPHQTS